MPSNELLPASAPEEFVQVNPAPALLPARPGVALAVQLSGSCVTLLSSYDPPYHFRKMKNSLIQ